MAIRVGILGYGNLRKGMECAVKHSPDMELKAVFTRRSPDSLSISIEGAKVYRVGEASFMRNEIDVTILCGGSATDLLAQILEMAAHFNVIDSFDTHANTLRYSKAVDKVAKEGGHVGIISVGWDPGMFSLNRFYANAILPGDSDYTFWGKGVSRGHSDAVCRVKGVEDVRQYTISAEAVLTVARSEKAPEPTTKDKHARECSVVAEEGADLKAIRETVVTMPNYSVDYDIMVHFVSREELMHDYIGIPHGGFVIRIGSTGWNDENDHAIEYNLRLDSNPEFTTSVIVAYARVAYHLSREGQSEYRTVFDIALAHLSPVDGAELRRHLLQSVFEKYIPGIQITENSHMSRPAGVWICFLPHIGLLFRRSVMARFV